MIDIMSYQYPPPPQNGAATDMSSSGYLPGYHAPSQPSSGLDPSSDADSRVLPRERSDSLSKSMKLKRSISTPVAGPLQSHLQAAQSPAPQQSTASGQDPPGERRRNKLGYHRTSVACGKYLHGLFFPPDGNSVSRSDLDAKASRRTLPSPKDQMCPIAKRCSGALYKLYPPQKGMQFLPCRPTATYGCKTEVGIAVFRGAQDRLRLFVARDADGNPIRHAWAANILSDDDPGNSEHAATDETTWQ